jgi:hypothetical protein
MHDDAHDDALLRCLMLINTHANPCRLASPIHCKVKLRYATNVLMHKPGLH